MRSVIGSYAINAFAFAVNLGAVFVYLAVGGPEAYGSYSIYIVFMAALMLMDTALVKAALLKRERCLPALGEGGAEAAAVRFLAWYIVPLAALGPPLVLAGDLIYPYAPETGVGGSVVMAVALVEHALSLPTNRLTLHWTLRRRFYEIYGLRLMATIVRHAIAWTVLLATGSVLAAIVAIVLKGVLLGTASWWWSNRAYPTQASAHRPKVEDYLVLGSFFGAAALLFVAQELPSFYVDRTYGREILGEYRLLYDVVVAVWFVATIYPSMLFAHLLPAEGRRDRRAQTAKLMPLIEKLALFHAAYCFGALAVVAGERMVFGLFADAGYVEGVVVGITILGLNRFLIEAAQANGLGRGTLAATVLAGIVVAGVLALAPRDGLISEVGLAWLVGQLVFYFCLKAMLAWRVLAPGLRIWSDVAILTAPATLAATIVPSLSPLEALVACGLLSSAYLALFGWSVARDLAPFGKRTAR